MGMGWKLALAAGWMVVGAGWASGATTEVVIDAVKYPTAEAAQRAWTSVERNTPTVGLAKAGGRNVLRLPGNFGSNEEWRTAWDLKGKWDLSGTNEVVLEFARGGKRGMRMMVYFRSGDGWYRQQFFAPAGGKTVVIRRWEFETEGSPEGWDRIETVRLGMMRDGKEDGEARLAGIRAIRVETQVALYRNDAGVGRESSVGQFVRIAGNVLDRAGVSFELVDDRAVAAGGLRGKKVAVLPLNPLIPPAAGEELKKFVAEGGKIIACYTLEDPIGELLGVESAGIIDGRKDGSLTEIVIPEEQGRGHEALRARQHSWIATKVKPGAGTAVVGVWSDSEGNTSDVAAVTRNANGFFVGHVLTQEDPRGKEELMLEMLGELWPGVWKEVYERQLGRMGKVAGMGGVTELVATATKNARGDEGREYEVNGGSTIAKAMTEAARKLAAKGEFREAWKEAREAQQALTAAFANSVRSQPGEMRAVWCHSAEGLPGKSWDEAMKTLAENGFNTAMVNLSWGDGAAYPSAVLPMVTEKDKLAEALAAAKEHGIALHVWRVCWWGWHEESKGLRDKLEREGRLQRDAQGKVMDWLCPSQESNRKLETEAMLEVVRKYDVAGIHFDYIRYPGMSGCYCERCRETFEKRYGVKVGQWPGEVIRGDLRGKYLEFRRENITTVVEMVSREAHKLRPGVKVSAAVFWDWTSARDEVGQDWKGWVEKGYLDFVCPMQYTTDAELFEQETVSTMGWAGGRVPVIPGIGATLGLKPDETLEQVLMARKHGAKGFILFNYDATLAEDHLPLLGAGATGR